MDFKKNIINFVHADFLVLPETHCFPNQKIEIENYTLFQNNRKLVSNCVRGSGGIAIAVRNDILNDHVVIAVYDDKVDGQIGIKLKNCKNDLMVGIVGLYLSPDNYVYGRDAEGFFNNAAALWEDLSDCDLLVGAGDVNSRTKDIIDYVPDIDGDLVTPRSNPDQCKNAHGNCFLTFLRENRSIILNGRVTPEFDNFTFISPNRGSSVPDYQFCPLDQLKYCTSMKTLLMSDCVNMTCSNPPLNLPDHSILLGSFNTSIFNILKAEKYQNLTNCFQDKQPIKQNKKNLKKIDDNFFMSDDIKAQVDATILKLENIQNNQCCLDQIWGDVKNLFIKEMDSLPDMPKSNNKTNSKLFQKSQPFWNENLATAWANVCNAEKNYLNFNAKKNANPEHKSFLRQVYQNAQRTFDNKFRFFKRKYRKAEFKNIERLAESDPNEMWAKLKKLNNPPSSKVVLEIVREDGTISNDIKEILKRWHNDIGRLFSGLRNNPEFAYDDKFYEEIIEKKNEFENLAPEQQDQQSMYDGNELNQNISFEELSKAIHKAKLKKAFIEIPNEAVKNVNAKRLLHNFFQLCFTSGLSPTEWDSSNIKPIPKKDKDARDPLQNRCITLMCCIAKLYSSILNRRLQSFLEKNIFW